MEWVFEDRIDSPVLIVDAELLLVAFTLLVLLLVAARLALLVFLVGVTLGVL